MTSEGPGQHSRVVVAMSGGVDSSVAAYLLARDGYDVIGVTMRLWSPDDEAITPDHQGCCSIDDIEDARRVCQTIGVPHYVMNVEREFRQHVIDYFVAEYQRGRTPHPCIACNDRIKFDFLLARAYALDAEFIATGHYARVRRGADSPTLRLFAGLDGSKDQSYVLFGLSQAQLQHVLFPVGGFTKMQIRELAVEAGLHLADKKDSQEICFIPQGDYRQFLERRIDSQPGDVVDREGRVLGTHPGVEHFTVGQRRGLGIATPQPLFVTRIEPATRRVVVGTADDLLQRGAKVERVRFISDVPPEGDVPVDVKIRYNARGIPAILRSVGEEAVLNFDTPQRAVTPGQAAVFYKDDEVIGGGFISGPAD